MYAGHINRKVSRSSPPRLRSRLVSTKGQADFSAYHSNKGVIVLLLLGWLLSPCLTLPHARPPPPSHEAARPERAIAVGMLKGNNPRPAAGVPHHN